MGGVNVGAKNQIISGDFSLTSGDKLLVTIENGLVGKIAVTGVTAMPSGTKLVVNVASNMGYIASGSKFNLVETTDASAIEAISAENISANNSNSNIYGLLKFTTEKSANNLVLNVSRLAPAEVTQNKNSQNIYQNLNETSANSTGKLLDFQIYLNSSGLTGQSLENALNQLAPQSSKATLAVSSNIVNNSFDFAESRMKNFSNGLWVRPFAVLSKQDAVKDDDGYNAHSIGVAAGADKEFFSETTGGMALSYSRSNIKSTDGMKKNLITTYQVSLYNGHNFNKYFFDYLAAFAYNQYNSERSIGALKTTGYSKYAGQIYALKTTGGVVQEISPYLNFTPEISFTFLRNEIDSYNEKGADSLSLNVQKVSADFLEARIGSSFGYAGKLDEWPAFNKFISSLKISYGYAFINDAPTTVSSFEGQSTTFETKISSLDSSSLKIGAAITAYYLDDLNFNLAYEFEVKPSYQAHSASVNIRQKF